MYKLRNKRRLTTLAILSLLTFVIGAAFASAPGIIDVWGTVTVDAVPDVLVIWDEVIEPVHDPLLGGPIEGADFVTLGGTQRYNIINDDKTIVWAVTFDGDVPGLMGMQAIARNVSPENRSAQVTGATVVYDAAIATEMGITVSTVTGALTNIILPYDATAAMDVDVEFDPTAVAPGTDLDDITLSITITFDYVLAP